MLKATCVLSFSAGLLGVVVCGQEPAVLSLASEPHHHLALHNEYVDVYQVSVAPGDSVRLHRHDTDAISLSLSESLVTVHFPGKPDVRQKLTNGQIRLQARGYVHSTSVEGEIPFRNVTVDLLQPQTGERNGCAEVVAKEPMHCEGLHGQVGLGVAQFETDQTFVGLLAVKPHERVSIGGTAGGTLIVALDGGAMRSGENGPASLLGAGDFVWLDRGKAGGAFRNESGVEVRLVCFGFQARPAESGGKSRR